MLIAPIHIRGLGTLTTPKSISDTLHLKCGFPQKPALPVTCAL